MDAVSLDFRARENEIGLPRVSMHPELRSTMQTCNPAALNTFIVAENHIQGTEKTMLFTSHLVPKSSIEYHALGSSTSRVEHLETGYPK